MISEKIFEIFVRDTTYDELKPRYDSRHQEFMSKKTKQYYNVLMATDEFILIHDGFNYDERDKPYNRHIILDYSEKHILSFFILRESDTFRFLICGSKIIYLGARCIQSFDIIDQNLFPKLPEKSSCLRAGEQLVKFYHGTTDKRWIFDVIKFKVLYPSIFMATGDNYFYLDYYYSGYHGDYVYEEVPGRYYEREISKNYQSKFYLLRDQTFAVQHIETGRYDIYSSELDLIRTNTNIEIYQEYLLIKEYYKFLFPKRLKNCLIEIVIRAFLIAELECLVFKL